MIPIAKAYNTGREIEYITQVVASGRYSFGPFVERFEEAVRQIHGVQCAIATSSGTLALELLVRYWKGKGIMRWATTPFTSKLR
jgi:perosamine synthetase